jgi:predicted DNA-binding transcriptional regulator AlpA
VVSKTRSQPAAPRPKKFVGVNYLSDMLGVSPSTIRAWVKAKKFPAPLPFSRRWRWELAKVLDFLS